MHAVKGGCHCTNIILDVQLTREPAAYDPRACDCDFCRKHGAAYISDPEGSLVVRIRDQQNVGKYRQGSGLVDCLLCRSCGVLIGAVYQDAGRTYATVNVQSLDSRASFGPTRPASPKLLPDDQKIERWQALWFSNVTVVTEGA